MQTKLFQRAFGCLLAAAGLMLAASPALATEAGFRRFDAPAQSGTQEAIHVVLFYPTQDSARPVPMGPFTPTVAVNGTPDASFKGLLLLSHGAGGSELGHSHLARALARNGYLVAALRHPGDNWQDQSLLRAPNGAYFNERPRQASQVIAAILRDPEWAGRIGSDAFGPRIGALGHSAGGYTALALAGGIPDLARIASHCTASGDDPVFCSMGRRAGNAGNGPIAFEGLRDARVRAVAALAPVAVMFGAESLAAINIPAIVYAGEKDTFLVPRYHAEWLRQNMARAEYRAIPNAGHYAFIDTPSMPIPSPDGDLRADPDGFDRAVFQEELAVELNRFFDRVLQ